MNDPCDDFLDRRRVPPESSTLRGALLRRTLGVVRRRRRQRRLGLAAALAACYLAGLASMWLWQQSAPAVAPPPAEQTPVAVREQPSAPAPADGPREVPALVLERWAAQGPVERRAEFYRRAGDRYLENDGDVPAAVRCYALALDAGPEEDLEIAPDQDSWLLIALKTARKKEKEYAQSDS
jgi:hypothetical protein